MKKYIKYVLSYVPTKLPVGMTEYKAWLSDIVELCGPIADEASLKWVISNEVMRLSPGRDTVSKHTFVKLLRKYAANQLAAVTVQELKQEQDAARIAEQQKTEVTVATQGQTSDEKTEKTA